MFFSILIVFFSLIFLLVLHELGHFIFAKKFGVEVEEFGVGYPPRLFGKKIGETIYSVNLLPFGAFVRIKGEDGKINAEDKRAFSGKPIWQRFLILFGGVASFWIVAIVILSLMAGVWGLPMAISDDIEEPTARVQIFGIAKDSPAEIAGLKIGDKIIRMRVLSEAEKSIEVFMVQEVSMVKEVQEFIEDYAGKEIILVIERADESFDVSLMPRIAPPEEEGAMGVALVRTIEKKYNWYQAPIQGVLITARQSVAIPKILGGALVKFVKGEKVDDVKFVGPIGIGSIMARALQSDISSFLTLFVSISIWLALFNLLPIPALDGGKILFLFIEKIKGSSVNPKIEGTITAVFFGILILLMAFVTIRDIIGLF